MALGSKRLCDGLRKVLIGKEAHLRWDRERLVFVGQVACVRQAGENIFARQAGVVGEDLVFRLASRQEFQNELDGDTRPADDRLAMYVVEHYPSLLDRASPLVYVFRSGGAYANASDHEAVRAQWMRAAEANPADSRVVLNAALFLFVEDKGAAVDLLKRTLEADPGNQRVAANLGFLYAMEILGLDSFSGEIAATIPPAERAAAVEPGQDGT